MKNIAIPLLVAGSAQAQTAADTGAPAPWLGSDSVKDVCVTKAATDKGKWTSAQSATQAKRDGDGKELTGKVALAKIKMDKSLKAAADESLKQANIDQVSKATAASEKARVSELKEFTDFKKSEDQKVLIKVAQQASLAQYNAYNKSSELLKTYQTAVENAEAHLQSEQSALVEALCRLQPAAQIGKSDASSLEWGARAEAIQTANAKITIYDKGTKKCTIPEIPNYDGATKKDAETIANGAGFTQLLSTETAKLTTVPSSGDVFNQIYRSPKQITDWHTANVNHLKYVLDRARQDVTDAIKEKEASTSTASTLKTALEDGSFNYDGTNTIKSVQKAYYDAIAHMAGEGQLLGMRKDTQVYLPNTNTATKKLGTAFTGATNYSTLNDPSKDFDAASNKLEDKANPVNAWYLVAMALSEATETFHKITTGENESTDTFTAMKTTEGKKGDPCATGDTTHAVLGKKHTEDLAACKKRCKKLPPWQLLAAGDRKGLPDLTKKIAKVDDLKDGTECYGISWDGTDCRMATSGIPKGADSGSVDSTECFSRDASVNALNYFQKYVAVYGGSITKGGETTADVGTLASPKSDSKQQAMIDYVEDKNSNMRLGKLKYIDIAGAYADGEAMVAATFVSWMKLVADYGTLDTNSKTGGSLANAVLTAEKAWAVATVNQSAHAKTVAAIQLEIDSLQADVTAQQKIIDAQQKWTKVVDKSEATESGEISEIAKVLQYANDDRTALRTTIAKQLNDYMNNCDTTKDADAKCDYATLWNELNGYNTSLGLADDKKYKEPTKADGKYTYVSNLTKLQTDQVTFLKTYDEAKKQAKTDIEDQVKQTNLVSAELGKLRTTAAEDVKAYKSALDTYNGEIVDLKKKEKEALEKYETTRDDCKVAQYDLYHASLKGRETTRTQDLEKIKKLLADTVAPARGAAGARCEKALSNGTFRPARSATTCTAAAGKVACCGAARIPIPGADAGAGWMTVETCGTADQKTYSYTPPRKPMATTNPTAVDYAFTCIQGARKLAAAASALAAAVYMLA